MPLPTHIAGRVVRGLRVLVTGGSEGIGFAVARRMAMSGAEVTLLARDPARLAEARATLSEQVPGTRVAILSLDVSDVEAVRAALPSALPEGELDVLVNAAGISRPGLFDEIPPEAFRRQMDVNFTGAVEVTRAVLPALLRSRRAHIVNIGSVSSVVATLGHPAYAATKFALYGFSDVLRAELALRGVRVSIVLPPETKTRMLEQERPFTPPAALRLQGTAGQLTVDEVARATLRGMARGQFEIIPGVMARATVVAFRLCPGLVRAYADWVVRSGEG
jgi:3-dehydrosphinganine reductase